MKIFSDHISSLISHIARYAPSSGENLTLKMSFKSDATYYFHITKCPSLFTRVFGFDSEKLSKWQFFGVKTFFHFVFERGWNEWKFERGWSEWKFERGWSEWSGWNLEADGADGANRT